MFSFCHNFCWLLGESFINCENLTDYCKNDEWKGKPKLLRLSDCTLIDVVMPRGYTSFRILDIWGNKMFISDDQTKLNLCEIIFE